MSLEISKQDILNALSEELASLAQVCKRVGVKEKNSIQLVRGILIDLMKEGMVIKQGRNYQLNKGETAPKKPKQKSLEDII